MALATAALISSGVAKGTRANLLRGGVHDVAPLRGLGIDKLAANEQLDGGGLDGVDGCVHGAQRGARDKGGRKTS